MNKRALAELAVMFMVACGVTAEPQAKPALPGEALAGGQAGEAAQALTPDSAGMITNSLKMKFVPVAGTEVMFSLWETRVQDYAAFAANTGRKWNRSKANKRESHPAVNVSWDDARTFCAWLTEKERKSRKIGANQEYRLPSDWEWSLAAGLTENKEGAPQAKSGLITGEYPWGQAWPPAPGAGNYCGEEAKGVYTPSAMIAGYNDGYVYTAPAGTFRTNSLGLYDLGGNVWEWCEDGYADQGGERVLRGGCWSNAAPEEMLSAYRSSSSPDTRNDSIGFRCVLTCPADELTPQLASATHEAPPANLLKTNSVTSVQDSNAKLSGTPGKITFSGKLICAVCGGQVSGGAVGVRLKDLSFLKHAGLTLTRSGAPVLTVDQNPTINPYKPVFYFHGSALKDFRLIIKDPNGKVLYQDELDPELSSNLTLKKKIEGFIVGG